MADNKPMTATLELRYVPDTYTETERQEGASWPLGSGFYDLVAVVDGAPLPVHRFKAGAVDKQFALAKQQRDEQAQQASEQTPPPAQPAPTQPAQPAQPPTTTEQQQAPPPEQQQPVEQQQHTEPTTTG